jgi:hypothetical protein
VNMMKNKSFFFLRNLIMNKAHRVVFYY